MPRLTTVSGIKLKMLTGMLVAGLTALVGFQATGMAAQAERLWSVVVHFEYDNGSEYDYVLRTGVSTEQMHEALEDCGRSHWTGSVVRYYCYPIPE